MKHKSLNSAYCPIARSLAQVGEWWSILILREAFYGATRFDDFQKGVEGIAPNMLTRRLKELVASGLFERRRYSERPERYEYVLTPRGHDFYPVLWALMEWGNKHLSPGGAIVQLRNLKTGKNAIPHFTDANTGREMIPSEYCIYPGPGASPGVRKHISATRRKSEI